MWGVGHGKASLSQDGGATWTRWNELAAVLDGHYIHSVWMPNPRTVVAVGSSGLILRGTR
jgi:photosystem II stability/assembly factor-like uncharacterized protein